MATATSDLSEARTREMRAPMMPSISAGAEYYQAPGYDEVITNRGLTSGMLALDYTAVDFGRRMSRVRAARYAAEAARLGIVATRAQIVFDITVAYFDLMRAKRAVLETQANVDRLSRYVDTIDQLQRSGRAIENDSLKARTVRDTAELALSDARNDQLRASMVLGSMIGDFTRNDFDIVDITELPRMPNGDLRDTPTMRAAMRADRFLENAGASRAGRALPDGANRADRRRARSRSAGHLRASLWCIVRRRAFDADFPGRPDYLAHRSGQGQTAAGARAGALRPSICCGGASTTRGCATSARSIRSQSSAARSPTPTMRSR